MVREEAGVDLDDIDLIVVQNVLGIDEAHDAQLPGHVLGVLQNGLFVLLADMQGRIDGNGVAGVDAGARRAP